MGIRITAAMASRKVRLYPRNKLEGRSERREATLLDHARPNPSALGVLNIFIAHENLAAARRARELRQRLAANLRHETRIEGETWNFALLANAHLRERASIEAAYADMIIISANGGSDLPAHVKAWLETLPPAEPNNKALVSLLDVNETQISMEPTRRYLGGIAEKSGMDFFCNPLPPQSGQRENNGSSWLAAGRLHRTLGANQSS
jgi:hypothetical protein